MVNKQAKNLINSATKAELKKANLAKNSENLPISEAKHGLLDSVDTRPATQNDTYSIEDDSTTAIQEGDYYLLDDAEQVEVVKSPLGARNVDHAENMQSVRRSQRGRLRASQARQAMPETIARPGMVQRSIIEQTPGRVQHFLKSGWTFRIRRQGEDIGDPKLSKQILDVHKKSVGTCIRYNASRDGRLTYVLMEIPQELYDEDQALKEKEQKERMDALLSKNNRERSSSGLSVKQSEYGSQRN